MKRASVVLFTKPAIPGRVKTRLIGPWTANEAAELHAGFLGDVSARLVSEDFDLLVAWALEEQEDLPKCPIRAIRQAAGDLGSRLKSALGDLAGEYEFVAAIGSDHPELPPERAGEAFDSLEQGSDVVIGPARDGGYYLLALRPEIASSGVFRDIPWSSERVLETTLERCRELSLAVDLLPEGDDVDLPEDVHRLWASLQASPEACPQTFEVLSRWQAEGRV